MDRRDIKALLDQVSAGHLAVDSALDALTALPFEDIGVALIDHHRELRTGMPEVIFGEGKTSAQIAAIALAMVSKGGNVLATRVASDKAAQIHEVFQARRQAGDALPDWSYDEEARTLSMRQKPFEDMGRGLISVVCAGTSDLPVAREALVTAEMMNNRCDLTVDVGVAGLHRVLSHRERLARSEVVIAVAGMEGALTGVLAGLIGRPVIGVPTSIGYGASFSGVSALLTMLNSCAPGVTVVNIDNGYGAAAAATLINRRREG